MKRVALVCLVLMSMVIYATGDEENSTLPARSSKQKIPTESGLYPSRQKLGKSRTKSLSITPVVQLTPETGKVRQPTSDISNSQFQRSSKAAKHSKSHYKQKKILASYEGNINRNAVFGSRYRHIKQSAKSTSSKFYSSKRQSYRTTGNLSNGQRANQAILQMKAFRKSNKKAMNNSQRKASYKYLKTG